MGDDYAWALNPDTVFDDASPDVLTGGAGSDWFLFRSDGRNRAADKTAADAVLAL